MARGGSKKGLPGTPAGYGAQPVRTAPSGQYGQAAASASGQGAVPIADATEDRFAPGSVPLDMASNRPKEPITEGASFGAGRNLQDLQMPTQRAAPVVDPKLFASYLPQMEAVASQPDSSAALRSFVRRLRSQLPVDFDPTGDTP